MKWKYLEQRNEMQRIFGGIHSGWPIPWQAILYRYGDYACGAIIIDQTTLLTAAHCFYEILGYGSMDTRPWVYEIAVGSNLKKTKSFDRLRPSQIILHPDFDYTKHLRQGNDIAVIKLPWKHRLSWNIDIEPICLPTKNFQDVIEDCDLQIPRPQTCPFWMSMECYISGFGKVEACK